MGIKAKLFFCEQERELLTTDITYYRDICVSGKPSTETIGGMVFVSFTPRGDEDNILEWMFADRTHNKSIEYPFCLYTLKKAEIIFFEGDYNGRKLFKYKLEDCTVVYYKESFSNESGMENTLVLSAAIQYYKNDETFLLKSWQESWIPPTESKNRIQNKKLPKLSEYHLEDLKYNVIKKEEIKENEEIYLVITSKNTKDLIANIDIENKSIDYEYNGKWMKNDIIKGVVLNDSLTRVKLKAVKQQK